MGEFRAWLRGFDDARAAAALRQLGEEYQHPALSWFDRLVNGLNRLPRPFLAFGTLGLFTYAMVDPEAFATRMVGLNAVPELSLIHISEPTRPY